MTDELAEGLARRDAARDATAAAHPERVKAEWLDAIHTTSRQHVLFTTDDVIGYGLSIGLAHPREPRLFGPLMKQAASNGWCTSTGASRPSRFARRHAGPKAVWLSTSSGAVVRQCECCDGLGISVQTPAPDQGVLL